MTNHAIAAAIATATMIRGPDANRKFLDTPLDAATNPAFTADERLAMRLAIAMTRDIRVDKALGAEIERRFDATERVELIATIATYNMVARFLVATGVEPERPLRG